MHPGWRRSRPALGIALILVMALCFATLDTSVKYVGAFLPVLVILWSRYAFQALVMGVWLAWKRLRSGEHLFRAAHPKFQAVRGALLLSTSSLSFYGLQLMPVAEFTAVAMLTPVVVTLLAAAVMREHVSLPRWALVLGGFGGALIIIRPGSGLFGWAAAFPLALACAYGVFQVLTSRLASLEHPLTTHFYTGLVGTVALSLALWLSPVDIVPPLRQASGLQWALLVLIGAMGTAGHLFLILALGVAPMSVLMPFTYAQIACAMGVSWLVFRHVPDGFALLGMLVIAACGAASVWLNVREAAARRAPDSVVAADASVGD
jgi:drug/metabolite transporter (DMT)-like permease